MPTAPWFIQSPDNGENSLKRLVSMVSVTTVCVLLVYQECIQKKYQRRLFENRVDIKV